MGKNDIDDRGYIQLSTEKKIKVVTRNTDQKANKVSWGLDEQK